MNGIFTPIDYVLIALYFSVLVGMGIFLQRKASASVEDYFIGGRKMPWWLLGISGMAQFIDIAGTALIISFLFMIGPKALLVELRGGMVIHMPIILLWAGKWHRRSGCLTGAEWMIFRFGNGPDGKAARIIKAISIQIFIIGMVTYLAKGVGIFFSTFLPFSPEACSLVLIIIACIYTAASGFYGVVFTDLIQALIIVSAVVVVTVMAVAKCWGNPDFEGLATSVSGFEGWMSSLPKWKIQMPAGYENYNWLGMLTILYLTKTLINGMGGGDDPKYFGARNDRECGTLTFLWTGMVAFRWPMMIGVAILGMFYISNLVPDLSVLADAEVLVKAYLPEGLKQAQWAGAISDIVNNPAEHAQIIAQLKDLLGDTWSDKLSLLSFHGTINAERILPVVILNAIPAGLKGLLLIALTAACMSTFDSNVNWSVSFITRDIYQAYFRPKAENKELIRVSWIATIAIAVIGYLLAYTVKNINDIWGWLMMALGTGFFVPSAIKFYWGRFNAWGFTTGMAMGVGAAVVQRIFWPEMPELHQFFLTAGLSLFGSIVGTLLTKPMDEEILKNFYTKTKPFGFWGKWKALLDPETRKKMSKEHFFDIVALPFVLVWHYLLLLLPVMLVIGNYKESIIIAVFFVISMIGMYIFWYRNLPKANMYEDVES